MNRAPLVALFFSLLACPLGCELLSGIDRAKIAVPGGDGGYGGAGEAGGAGGATASSSSSSSTGTGGSACVPVDDKNPCTDDVCANGQPAHPPTAAGTLCSMGGTQCDGMGSCVECLAKADCAGTDDACQTRTCAQGKCGHAFTAAGTALPMQTAGDCKKSVCDGSGATTAQSDDTDLPDDKNACTDDLCAAGVPSNPAKAKGTSCGATLVCDANGACVGCNTAADCPGTDDECKARTCAASACGVAFTAANTAVAAQTAGDCLKAVCDGSGNVAAIADDTDLPPDDGNACTGEACNAGAPSHPAKANGFACDDSNACTQADTCQSGVCAGQNPVVCAALDQCHAVGACNPATGVCSNPAKANGAACTNGDACTQSDTCQAGSCLSCPLATACPTAVGWWPAENNANDFYTLLNGTLGNGVTFAAGQVGQAFVFDGTNDVGVADAPSLTLATVMTIEAWINVSAVTANLQTILGKNRAIGGDGYFLSILSGNLVFGLNDGNNFGLVGSTVLPTNTWVHVAATRNLNVANLYVNGVLDATSNAVVVGSLIDSALQLTIGSGDTVGGRLFTGLIDEPAVYNTALDDAGIAAIYAAGARGKCQPALTCDAASGTCK